MWRKQFLPWPSIDSDKEAIISANIGTAICVFMAMGNAFLFFVKGIWPENVPYLYYVLTYSPIAYFTFKLSRVATTIGFLLFSFDKLWVLYATGEKSWLSFFVAMFLLHAMRAAYWYQGEKKVSKVEAETPGIVVMD